MGLALIRAELLHLASVLARDGLLRGRGAVGTGSAVFPPALGQIVLVEQLTAWIWRREEGERQGNVSLNTKARTPGSSRPIKTCPVSILTFTAEGVVPIVDSLDLLGWLLNLAVLAARHLIVELSVLLGAIYRTEEYHLIL